MRETVSKFQFKPRALEYLRQVEKTRTPLVITDRGRPVLKLIPYAEDPDEALQELRGSVLVECSRRALPLKYDA